MWYVVMWNIESSVYTILCLCLCLYINNIRTFWGIWLMISLSTMYPNLVGFITFNLLVYVVITCFFNPFYYSTSVRVSRGCKQFMFIFYFVVGGVVGAVQIALCAVNWYIKGVDDPESKLLRIPKEYYFRANIFWALLASLLYYFPSTGYLFYRDFLWFGLSHTIMAAFSMSIPLIISQTSNIKDQDFITFPGLNITSPLEPFIFMLLVFCIFLSVSGFSCTYYRYKKAIIESQHHVTGYKKLDLNFLMEFPMTITMALTLLLSFGDVVTDFLFAFSDYIFGTKIVADELRLIAVSLFLAQILVQLFSLQSAVKVLLKQLKKFKNENKNTNHVYITWPKQLFLLLWKNKLLKCFIWLIYPIMFILYYIFIILISMILGISKLIAIKQIEQWWLSLFVVNYEKLSENNNNKKSPTIKDSYLTPKSSPDEMNSPASKTMYVKDGGNGTIILPHHSQINDDNSDEYNMDLFDNADITPGGGLNNFHMAYWMELDQFFNATKDDQEIELSVSNENNNDNKIISRKKKTFYDTGIWLGWDYKNKRIGWIFKIYLFIDKHTPLWMRKYHINASIYNTYTLTELIVESIPNAILLISNAYIQSKWDWISLTSLFFSLTIIIYLVFKIVYYVGILNTDIRKVVL